MDNPTRNILETPEYPIIAPVPEGIPRPFWSVMIPTYNCAIYLERALRSVLDQAPEPENMQIEVIDDCSTTDDPEDVVNTIGKGRVEFFRQARNVGVTANFNTCIRRARGYWLHILNGDDMVLPGFYETYERLIQQYPDATLLTSPSIHIDDRDRKKYTSKTLAPREGPVSQFARRQAIRNSIRTPSVVIPRSVYEKVGGFCPVLSYSSDREMFFRAGIAGRVITARKALSCYREHAGNFTSRVLRTGQNIKEALLATEICLLRLPENVRHELVPEKYYWTAKMALQASLRLGLRRQWKASRVQAGWAARLSLKHFRFKWITVTIHLILSRLRLTGTL